MDVLGIPFTDNVCPMWVYDLTTLCFLEVNDAAVHVYGYSRDEFLSMTLLDIRPSQEIVRFLHSWEHSRESLAEGWTHVGKDGIPFAVSITSWEIEFRGHKAELVLAKREVRGRVEMSESLYAPDQTTGLTAVPDGEGGGNGPL